MLDLSKATIEKNTLFHWDTDEERVSLLSVLKSKGIKSGGRLST